MTLDGKTLSDLGCSLKNTQCFAYLSAALMANLILVLSREIDVKAKKAKKCIVEEGENENFNSKEIPGELYSQEYNLVDFAPEIRLLQNIQSDSNCCFVTVLQKYGKKNCLLYFVWLICSPPER